MGGGRRRRCKERSRRDEKEAERRGPGVGGKGWEARRNSPDETLLRRLCQALDGDGVLVSRLDVDLVRTTTLESPD